MTYEVTVRRYYSFVEELLLLSLLSLYLVVTRLRLILETEKVKVFMGICYPRM